MLTQRPDPETALRIACERMLLSTTGPDRGAQPRESAGDLATALVLLAGLSPGVAAATADEYATAMSLRGVGPPPHFRALRQQHAQQASQLPPLQAPEICVIGRELQIGDDVTRVDSVVIGPHRVAISVRYDHEPTSFSKRHAALMSGRHPGQTSLTVRDDRGTAQSAHFSGGGGGREWKGRWTTDGPLSPTTSWLDIESTRLELHRAMPACAVTVEERAVASPVHEYLWMRLAAAHHHYEARQDAVVELLAEVGLLTEDDTPFLEAYAAVAEALPSHRGGPRSRLRGAVPEHWQSVLDRSGDKGRVVTVPASALTPPFDGFELTVSNLRGTREGFEVDVEVRGPNGGLVSSSPFDDETCTNPLVWWAEDDLGNSYLGAWNGHGHSPDSAEGQMMFRPGLDKKATVLRIVPQTLTHRAVIEVRLP